MRSFLLFTFCFLLFSKSSQAQIITSFAGNGVTGFSGDGGPASAASLNKPQGIAVDDSGYVYIADAGNNRIRRISPSGTIVTIAGTGVAGFSGDSGPAINAQLNNPYGIAVDAGRNIYIADLNNSRVRIINTSGSITTIAGNGTAGFSGDGGAATNASLSMPVDVTTDDNGNIYIADKGNNRVRKLTAGIITTVAGSGTAGYTGDGGPATNASLNAPGGLVTDTSGALYIADKLNYVVRKLSPVGIITTFAGNNTLGISGNGGNATNAAMSDVSGLTIDTLGNLYIADRINNQIRMVNASDTISTFAGTGVSVYGGDGGAATNAGVVLPAWVVADCRGNVYISDSASSVIRRVSPFINHAPSFTLGSMQSTTVCVNSGANALNALLPVNDIDAGQTETWSLALAPANGTVVAAYATASTGGSVAPSGISYAPAAGYSGADSFIIQVSDGFTSDSILIVVNVNTSLSLTSDLTATSCSGSPVNYFATSNTPAAITWTRAAITGITPATGSGGNYIGESLVNATAAAINVVYVFNLVSSSCAVSQNVTVSVEPVGTVAPVISTVSPSWLCTKTMYQNFGAATLSDTGITYQWSARNANVWATGSTRQYCLVNFTTPGVAYVYLTATLPGYACGSKDSFAVVVAGSVAETHDITYFSGDFIAPEGMYSYQWGYDDKATLQPTVIAGATEAIYSNSSPDFAHNYYWVITEHMLCEQKSYYIVPAGVENINEGGISDVNIFPNPASGAFNINVTSGFNEEGMVTITNITGAKVMELPFTTNNKIAISLTEPAGLYFVNIRTPHGNYTGKVVLSR